jgi:site-specific recombinase XerC
VNGMCEGGLPSTAIHRAPTIRVRRPRRRETQPLGVDRNQARALLASAEAAGARDHALLCLLLPNGLLVREAIGSLTSPRAVVSRRGLV